MAPWTSLGGASDIDLARIRVGRPGRVLVGVADSMASLSIQLGGVDLSFGVGPEVGTREAGSPTTR